MWLAYRNFIFFLPSGLQLKTSITAYRSQPSIDAGLVFGHFDPQSYTFDRQKWKNVLEMIFFLDNILKMN